MSRPIPEETVEEGKCHEEPRITYRIRREGGSQSTDRRPTRDEYGTRVNRQVPSGPAFTLVTATVPWPLREDRADIWADTLLGLFEAIRARRFSSELPLLPLLRQIANARAIDYTRRRTMREAVLPMLARGSQPSCET